MRKIILSLCLMFPLIALALDPASVTITNLRGEAISAASADTFYRGEVINFTNCVVFSGTTNTSARQDLTGLTILLSWGDTVLTSSVVTGAVATATNGTWNASVTLRTTEGAKTYFQLRLTNSATSFTYPFKHIDVKAKL